MTSATNPKTIELYGYGVQHEGVASGEIVPGMLVQRDAGNSVEPHDDEAGPANTHFAVEYGMTGQTINDAYEVGDQVVYKTYVPGSGVYTWIGAEAPAVANKALLVSAGDGTLKALVAAEGGTVVAQALEAVDNSAGLTPARIRVEVMPAVYVAPVA